jgi:hypothetical protein
MSATGGTYRQTSQERVRSLFKNANVGLRRITTSAMR